MSSALLRLTRGARALGRGVAQTAGHRGVRGSLLLMMSALVLSSLAFTAGGLFAAWHFIAVEESAGWTWWGLWLLRLLASGFVVLLSPLLSLALVTIVAPVFAEVPFLAGMAHLAPDTAARLRRSEGLPLSTSMGNSLRRLLPFLLRSLLFFLLGFVPLLGPPLALVCQLANGAHSLGWELLDPYFDKEKLPFTEQKRIIASLNYERLGLGLAATPLLSIPLVGPLFFPLLQAGAARFVVDFLLPAESKGKPALAAEARGGPKAAAIRPDD